MRDLNPVRNVLKKLDSCPIAQHAATRILYLNEPKVDSLFDTTFPGISEIINVATESDEAEIEGAGRVGVSSGVIKYFIDLKAGLATRKKKGEARETSIKAEVTGIWRMALAELALDKQGLVGEKVSDIDKPYLRLTDVLIPFEPPVNLEDLAKSFQPETASVIMKRLEGDENNHPEVTQFVYAANDPAPIASVLIVPPAAKYGVRGTSDACYPGGRAWSRVFFGIPSQWKGVTFIDPYYVIDFLPKKDEAADQRV